MYTIFVAGITLDKNLQVNYIEAFKHTPMNRKILILSIPMILAVFLLGGWLLFREPQSAPESQNPQLVKERGDSILGIPVDMQIDSIDTSNWKMYQNETVSFKYPPQYEINTEGIRDGLIVFGTPARLKTEYYSGGMEEVSETGFVVSVEITKLNISALASASKEKNVDSLWRTWVGRDRDSFGNTTFQNVSYKGNEMITIDDRGMGSLYKNEHIVRNYNIPNDTKSSIAEVAIHASAKEFPQFEDIVLGVVQTLRFR